MCVCEKELCTSEVTAVSFVKVKNGVGVSPQEYE